MVGKMLHSEGLMRGQAALWEIHTPALSEVGTSEGLGGRIQPAPVDPDQHCQPCRRSGSGDVVARVSVHGHGSGANTTLSQEFMVPRG